MGSPRESISRFVDCHGIRWLGFIPADVHGTDPVGSGFFRRIRRCITIRRGANRCRWSLERVTVDLIREYRLGRSFSIPDHRFPFEYYPVFIYMVSQLRSTVSSNISVSTLPSAKGISTPSITAAVCTISMISISGFRSSTPVFISGPIARKGNLRHPSQ